MFGLVGAGIAWAFILPFVDMKNAVRVLGVPAWAAGWMGSRRPARTVVAAAEGGWPRTRVWPGALAIAALSGAVLACPIQRPPVPADYYDFQAVLRAAVADSAEVALAERWAARSHLEQRLPELAARVETDSLLEALAADSLLSPLAAVVDAALRRALESNGVSGGVRKAFRKPDGQRLAVDAILIGLGQALRRLDVTGERPPH